MYFNEGKKNTNINNQFKKSKKKRKERISNIIAIIIIIIILLGVLFGIYKLKNRNSYKITLLESDEITIYKNSEYIEPGYIAIDKNNKDVTSEVKVSGIVNTNEVGEYLIKYEIKKEKKIRKVKVIEQGESIPTIHLFGEMNMMIKVGEKYNDPGYTAVDTIEGDITDKVSVLGKVNTNKEGTYEIVYSVTNSKGATSKITRTVFVTK